MSSDGFQIGNASLNDPRLLPAESIALTVARAQVARGENPAINVTTMLVMALDRLTAAAEPPAPVHREEGKG